MALTASELQALVGGRIDKSRKMGNAIVRTTEGKLERQTVKPSQFGRFEGKQGTKRRSRKGLVRTMPNGYVKYNDVTDVEVVMYQA